MKKILSLGFLCISINSFASSKFEVSGDLRYRIESTVNENSADRYRHRIRGRIKSEYALSEDTKAVLGLATGTNNPVSRNITLDSSFQPQGIALDQAYLQSKFFEGAVGVKAGKMKSPFYIPWKSELLWDNDLTPEGIYLSWNKGVHIGTWALWVEERSDDDDTMLLGADIHKTFSADGIDFTPSLSYFSYTNAQGQSAFGAGFKGNSNTSSVYDNGFEILNASLGFSGNWGELPWMGYFEWVQNFHKDAINQPGFAIGLSVGKVKTLHDWSVKYIYKRLEADAVVGAFTDSNFNDGNTDGQGHEISVTYGVSDFSNVKLAAFVANKSILNSDAPAFNRFQVDFLAKF